MSDMAKTLDLDAALKFDDEPVHTKDVILFGTTWTLICDLNSFSIASLASGDAASIRDFIANLVVVDQRADFLKALGSQRGLSGERLGLIINKLIETVSENPTTPPSASSPGVSTKRPAAKSPARSSSTRAVRSAR